MRAVIVAGERAQHQQSWGGAFAAGLRRHGVDAQIMAQPAPCDLLVLWGVRRQDVIRRQKAAGGEVCILERGYLSNRMAWTSVSFGGRLNGRAVFRGTSSDPARFLRAMPEGLQPWRRKDGYALLIGQVPGDMSLVGVNMSRWYHDMAGALKRAGFAVKFRSHPVADNRGFRPEVIGGVPQISGTLAEAFEGAAVVTTFNSNTAVEAVIAGIPTIATDLGSMAWDVAGHSVAEIITPPREEWAARLAWKQWTLEEMSSGECWARIGRVECPA